jgi:hypothetical protein
MIAVETGLMRLAGTTFLANGVRPVPSRGFPLAGS